MNHVQGFTENFTAAIDNLAMATVNFAGSDRSSVTNVTRVLIAPWSKEIKAKVTNGRNVEMY